MKEFIWRNFEVRTPDGWEMLQFSKDPMNGGCLFADRYMFRLEINWRRTGGEPDLERILSDYMGKLKDGKRIRDERYVNAAGWRGIEGTIDGTPTTRFGKFFPYESCLIEAVFLWPGSRDQGLEKEVLDGIAERPASNGVAVWKSFGMEIRTGADLFLETCEVKPALARMFFRSGKDHRIEESFERMGMVEQWMKKEVKDWLMETVPKETKIEKAVQTPSSGHKIELIRGYRFASMNDRVFNRKTHYLASAWICPNDGRLYRAAVSGLSEPAADPRLAGTKLKCCKAI